MADCSKTEVFISELKRMHMHYSSRIDGNGCNDCPARWDCMNTMFALKWDDIVKRVQKWSDEHPDPMKKETKK